jgi:outer membrane protein assembly factor BamA
LIALKFIPCLLLVVFIAISGNLFAQDSTQYDIIDFGRKVFKKEAPRKRENKTKKLRFSLVPASNGSQGRVSISAINLAFYLADPDQTNISTVYFYPYTNFNGRYSFMMNSNLWTYRNLYNLIADFKISSNEIKDYGLGSLTSVSNYNYLSYGTFRSHLLLNRLIARYLYFGFGYYLDYYDNIESTTVNDTNSDFDNYSYGTGEINCSSGIVFNLLRDSRKNSINPDNGFYTNFSFQIYRPAFGSTYSWEAFVADARKYIRLSLKNRHILSFRVVYWGSFGQVPYIDMPATFTDREARMGRGYYYARFRGNQVLYGETEYRFDLLHNGFIGGVLFANVQSYSKTPGSLLMGLDPSLGFGIRVKFNKQSNANLTFDLGFGKDSFNWHVNLGEFF